MERQTKTEKKQTDVTDKEINSKKEQKNPLKVYYGRRPS